MKTSNKLFLSSITILSYLCVASSYRLNTENQNIDEDVGGCDRAIKRAAAIERATVVFDSPDVIHGKWVSEGCETRPGPEFLLRSYTFHPNGTFKLLQFYYSDDSCSSPAYTIIAKGHFRSSETYSLHTVSIVPHGDNIAFHLSAKINSTCPGLIRKRWRTDKEYFLLNLSEDQRMRNHRPFQSPSSNDEFLHRIHISANKKPSKHHYAIKFNCLHSLSLVFHELQHYKVQIRPGLNDKSKTTYYRQELHLGDIHTKIESRASYKPTTYQVPLLKVDIPISESMALESASLIRSDSLLNVDAKGIQKMRGRIFEKSYVGHFDIGAIGDLDAIFSPKSEEDINDVGKTNAELFKHCHVCSAVYAGHEKSPPYLMAKAKLPLFLSGEWVSLHCEQRPMNLYLTRHFRFYVGDLTWIVEYKFYYDTICTGHSFSVTAAGHYKIGKTNHRTAGGTEIDFHLEKASLTVFDPNMMDNLKHDPDCGVGQWKLGYPREMSATHGCPTLGLVVPSIEYELLRMESDFYGSPLLYMGQVETENRKRSSHDRPTSYQPALIQCQTLPMHSENLREILSSPLYGDDIYSNYGSRVLAMESDYTDSGSEKFQHSSYLLLGLFILIILS